MEFPINPRDVCKIYSLQGEELCIINENMSEHTTPLSAYQDFDTNKSMKMYIEKEPYAAIKTFVYYYKEDIAILNIHHAGNSCNIDEDSLTWDNWYVKEQLEIFMPLIKQFLLYGFKSKH